jgi:tetratricopeptide (TPR) repeat protein
MAVGCLEPVRKKDEIAFDFHGNRYEPEGYKTTYFYRWNAKEQQFQETRKEYHDPWADNMAVLEGHLAKGRFERARAQVTRMGTSPNGGHSDVTPLLSKMFFNAYHEHATRLYKKGKKAEAADLAMMVLYRPPLIERSEHADKPLIERAGWVNTVSKTRFPIEKTPKHLGMLNDLAFFLGENGDLDEAIEELNTVIREAPEREVAYLNLADVLWAKEHDTAKYLYRQYVDLMTKKQKTRAIPKRARDRAAPP